MAAELAKLGINTEELDDGLIIQGDPERTVPQVVLDGHGDHRVVMALAVAALRAAGPISISTAEAATVTFPTFFSLLDEIRTAK